MKQFFYLSVFCVLALGACTGAFKKGDKGLEYKIISEGNGKAIKYGNYLQMHIKQVYAGTKDTVLSDSREIMPNLQLFDSISTPLQYYKIIKQLRKGDSLVIRQLTDTVYSGSQQGMPPFMKKGKYIYTSVRLINVFETQAEADSANKAERLVAKPKYFKKQLNEIEKGISKFDKQRQIDDKIIADYLAKNNIKAEKTKWGTYVAISAEGTGDKIDYDDIVSVNYTCKTLDSGRVVDSNTDPKFKAAGPYEVTILNVGNGVILGWTDALQQLKKGSKATIYVPSTLAYGEPGRDGIKPNENLMFDIEVKDVVSEADKMAQQQAVQQKMIDDERKRTDSIEKATPKPKN